MNTDIKLDHGFKEFELWCRGNDIPVVIVSR
jgi:2-hydroxy-3-keto-5-methylthiopentenyl-1-phosphate phosphatase